MAGYRVRVPEMETKRPSRIPLLASVVVVVILALGLGYFYVTSTQTEASLNSTISSQSTEIGAQSSSIHAQSESIATLQGSISTLGANVTAYQILVASLNSMIAADGAQIASLKAELRVANSTIKSDSSTITSLNSQITTLQSQVSLASSIEANDTSIINLSYSKSLVSNLNVTIYGRTHTSSTPFETLTSNFAGYVLITFTKSTESSFLNSTAHPSNLNPGGGVYETWTFLAPSSPLTDYVIVPVSPGNENTFALISTAATDGTALVTATYYY
jgi:hypothetical protein